MAEELKSLQKDLNSKFLASRNETLGTKYKSLKAYLTDNGNVQPGTPVYARRQAAYNKFGTQYKTDLETAAINSGMKNPAYEDTIREMYPELAAYFDEYPAVRSIFIDAVTAPNPPSATILRSRLAGTDFWQTLTDTKVKWDTGTQAFRDAALSEKSLKVVQIAQGLGVSLSQDDDRVKSVATDAARLGWSDASLANAVGKLIAGDTGDMAELRSGYLSTKVNAQFNDYGYVSKGQRRAEAVNEWVSKIATGAESLQTLQTYLTEQAKVLYPSFTKDFEAGRTFKQVVAPYADVAATVLEKDAASIDWSDPLYSVALNQGPQADNKPMSLSEWQRKLRSDAAYGWNQTQNANDLARQIGSTLARAFGKVR